MEIRILAIVVRIDIPISFLRLEVYGIILITLISELNVYSDYFLFGQKSSFQAFILTFLPGTYHSIKESCSVSFMSSLKQWFRSLCFISAFGVIRACFFLNIYLLVETFLHIFHKIFLPEHDHGKMANRSIILLLFNFAEVIASFGVIYSVGNYFNLPIQSWIDALYFSLVTGVTIGYGDFYPINQEGKVMVMMQILSTIAFLFLFFNFFGPRSSERLSHQENPK